MEGKGGIEGKGAEKERKGEKAPIHIFSYATAMDIRTIGMRSSMVEIVRTYGTIT